MQSSLSSSVRVTASSIVSPIDWTVVGAGPAGVVCVASLLDNNIDPQRILWVDPAFRVGRMEKYVNVPGNNKARQVMEFLDAFKSFRECQSEATKNASPFANRTSGRLTVVADKNSRRLSILQVATSMLKSFDPEREYVLGYTRSALQGMSECFCDKLRCKVDTVTSLQQVVGGRGWLVSFESSGSSLTIFSQNVVMATGSTPVTLDDLFSTTRDSSPVLYHDWKGYLLAQESLLVSQSVQEIPYDVALNRVQLDRLLHPSDTVVIFGSAQSAVLILKYVFESSKRVKRIINLYKHPVKFAVDHGNGWIENDAKGLKGDTARWFAAAASGNGDYVARVVRLENTADNRQTALRQATKVISAVGFRRNKLPAVLLAPDTQHKVSSDRRKLDVSDQLGYDNKTGEVTRKNPDAGGQSSVLPGLFALGIAFPELYTNPKGHSELRVGIPGFIHYAKRVVPAWLSSRGRPGVT